jgi:hypothetical protein
VAPRDAGGVILQWEALASSRDCGVGATVGCYTGRGGRDGGGVT